MDKKVLIQITLLVIIVLILAKIFTFYQSKKGKNLVLKEEDKKEFLNENQDSELNIIKDITYLAKDDKENIFKIESKFGKINPEEPDIVLMDNVTALITLRNLEEILISSDHAIYNSKSYETNFYDNVLLEYIEHNIASENIYLSFENNLVSISNNIIYKNLNSEMNADEIEMNLITKEIKIFMHNNENKIQILSKN
tara:strand:- start:1703 stop:2293 length:591 start_codon:yes stop_codon:yes gene_type:complete